MLAVVRHEEVVAVLGDLEFVWARAAERRKQRRKQRRSGKQTSLMCPRRYRRRMAGHSMLAEYLGTVGALADEARAGTVVSGTYYARGDSIHIQARTANASDGTLMRTVGPIVGFKAERSELVGRLAQEVVAALASLLDQDIGSWEPAVQPAAYDAYDSYNEGLEAYMRSEMDEAFRHFECAVATDSTFYRARLWAAQSYTWVEGASFAKVESLIAPLIESRAQLT
jgi:hypothetical protein